VAAVVQGLHAQIHVLAPGKRGRRAVFRQVVEGDGVNAHRIAIKTPGADVGQRVGVDTRGNAVDQAVVQHRTGGIQGGASGINFTAGNVGEAGALHIQRTACHQLTAVGDIPWRGEGEIAVGKGAAAEATPFALLRVIFPSDNSWPLPSEYRPARSGFHRLLAYRRH
jgi:hypothetical protein